MFFWILKGFVRNLSYFLYFSSLVMQDIKSESCSNLAKLCFIILSCISEDQYANALMSDAHLIFRVSKKFKILIIPYYIIVQYVSRK